MAMQQDALVTTTATPTSMMAKLRASWAVLGAAVVVGAAILGAAGVYAHEHEQDRLQRQCQMFFQMLDSRDSSALWTVLALARDDKQAEHVAQLAAMATRLSGANVQYCLFPRS